MYQSAFYFYQWGFARPCLAQPTNLNILLALANGLNRVGIEKNLALEHQETLLSQKLVNASNLGAQQLLDKVHFLDVLSISRDFKVSETIDVIPRTVTVRHSGFGFFDLIVYHGSKEAGNQVRVFHVLLLWKVKESLLLCRRSVIGLVVSAQVLVILFNSLIMTCLATEDNLITVGALNFALSNELQAVIAKVLSLLSRQREREVKVNVSKSCSPHDRSASSQCDFSLLPQAWHSRQIQ